MKALTLWRPWPAAILFLGKRVENRTWAPPAWLLGEFFAIHAGRRFEQSAVNPAPGTDLARVHEFNRHAGDQGIVAIARLVDVVRYSCPPGQDWWWTPGAIGWALDDVRRIDPPLDCRGAQGLWEVPARVRGLLEREAGRERQEDRCRG